MKFAKQLIALAAVAAAFSAQAESKFATGAGPLSAAARLDFRVIVPKVLFLQVGTGTNFIDNTAIDRVDFTLAAADVTSGLAIAGVRSPAGAITARVLGNGGDVTFGAAGTVGGLAGPGAPIPWSQIVPSVAGALIHPAIDAAASTVAATSGVVNQTSVYSFNYSNTSVVAAGTYNGRVTYTASVL